MSTDGEDYTPVAELGYEEARDELADIVSTLEHGGLDLDTSLACGNGARHSRPAARNTCAARANASKP